MCRWSCRLSCFTCSAVIHAKRTMKTAIFTFLIVIGIPITCVMTAFNLGTLAAGDLIRTGKNRPIIFTYLDDRRKMKSAVIYGLIKFTELINCLYEWIKFDPDYHNIGVLFKWIRIDIFSKIPIFGGFCFFRLFPRGKFKH